MPRKAPFKSIVSSYPTTFTPQSGELESVIRISVNGNSYFTKEGSRYTGRVR